MENNELDGRPESPVERREWAERIADQFGVTDSGAVDAIEEGVSRGLALGRTPSGFDPSRVPNLECPHCHEGLFVSALAAVGKNQRMSITIHPREEEAMVQAEALCGQIVDFDKIMQAIAKQDGGKVRTYVERVGMTDDGGFRFDLAVLDVRSWPARDSDGSGEAVETRSKAPPEATARAEGIARKDPS